MRLALVFALCLPQLARAESMVIDITPAFRPGSYQTITVNPANPNEIAVGTTNGYVLVSRDAGRTADESHVLLPRESTVMVLRGIGSRTRTLRRAGADKLFMRLLSEGLPTSRWAAWMAQDAAATDIMDVTPPAKNGKMLIASSAGVFVSDSKHGAWTQLIGYRRPKGRDVSATAVAIDPAEPRHMLAATTDGIKVAYNGYHFVDHPDRKFNTSDSVQSISQFIWSADEPNRVLAVGPQQVFLSQDRGQTFQSAFQSPNEITALALADAGVWVASRNERGISQGLKLQAENGTPITFFKEKPIVGVVAIGDTLAIAATDEELTMVNAKTGEKRTLMRTNQTEPFIKLVGTDKLVYALTARSILRVGVAEPRTAPHEKPRLTVTMLEAQRLVQKRFNVGDPDRTRTIGRWYANLLPRLSVLVTNGYNNNNTRLVDGTFPIGARFAQAEQMSFCCGTAVGTDPEYFVMANWDLRALFASLTQQASNPQHMIDSGLRDMQKDIIEQVRSQYLSAAHYAFLLQRPPADEVMAHELKLRLEEHAAYLTEMCGREIMTYERNEEQP